MVRSMSNMPVIEIVPIHSIFKWLSQKQLMAFLDFKLWYELSEDQQLTSGYSTRWSNHRSDVLGGTHFVSLSCTTGCPNQLNFNTLRWETFWATEWVKTPQNKSMAERTVFKFPSVIVSWTLLKIWAATLRQCSYTGANVHPKVFDWKFEIRFLFSQRSNIKYHGL